LLTTLKGSESRFNVNGVALIDDGQAIVLGLGASTVESRLGSFFDNLLRRTHKDLSFEDYNDDPEHKDGIKAQGCISLFRRNEQLQYVGAIHIPYYKQVTAVQWDAPRRWLYVGFEDGLLRILNVAPDYGFVVKVLAFKLLQEEVLAFAFDPALSSVVGLAPFHLSVYDGHSQETTLSVHHPRARLNCVAIDGRNQRVFIGTGEHHVLIYTLRQTSSDPLVQLLVGHKDAVKCLDYHADAQLLISGSADDSCVVWKVGAAGRESDSLLTRRLMHPYRITAVRFCPDAHHFVVGDAQGNLLIADTKWCIALFAFKAHHERIVQLQVGQGGEILSGSHDHSAQFWSIDLLTSSTHRRASSAVDPISRVMEPKTLQQVVKKQLPESAHMQSTVPAASALVISNPNPNPGPNAQNEVSASSPAVLGSSDAESSFSSVAESSVQKDLEQLEVLVHTGGASQESAPPAASANPFEAAGPPGDSSLHNGNAADSL